jgi:hypothetical protein
MKLILQDLTGFKNLSGLAGIIPKRDTLHMPITPQEFISKWKRVTAREKQIYQEHFLDLCQLVGHQTPNDYDPTGTRFAFEMGAAKTSGGQGWADVAKLGFFGWEYKGKDADLDKAYEQLLRYEEILERLLALNLERGK